MDEGQDTQAKEAEFKKYQSQAEQDGMVEIVNPDGSKSQVKKEIAQAMIDQMERVKEQLK